MAFINRHTRLAWDSMGACCCFCLDLLQSQEVFEVCKVRASSIGSPYFQRHWGCLNSSDQQHRHQLRQEMHLRTKSTSARVTARIASYYSRDLRHSSVIVGESSFAVPPKKMAASAISFTTTQTLITSWDWTNADLVDWPIDRRRNSLQIDFASRFSNPRHRSSYLVDLGPQIGLNLKFLRTVMNLTSSG